MGTNARDIGPFSEAVSAELRALLARHKYTVRAFAKEHNIPLSTLHKTLRAERVVDVEDLYLICEPLGVDPAAVVEDAYQAFERGVQPRPIARIRSALDPETAPLDGVEMAANTDNSQSTIDGGHIDDENQDV